MVDQEHWKNNVWSPGYHETNNKAFLRDFVNWVFSRSSFACAQVSDNIIRLQFFHMISYDIDRPWTCELFFGTTQITLQVVTRIFQNGMIIKFRLCAFSINHQQINIITWITCALFSLKLSLFRVKRISVRKVKSLIKRLPRSFP